jgi:hypothetical protein
LVEEEEERRREEKSERQMQGKIVGLSKQKQTKQKNIPRLLKAQNTISEYSASCVLICVDLRVVSILAGCNAFLGRLNPIILGRAA